MSRPGGIGPVDTGRTCRRSLAQRVLGPVFVAVCAAGLAPAIAYCLAQAWLSTRDLGPAVQVHPAIRALDGGPT